MAIALATAVETDVASTEAEPEVELTLTFTEAMACTTTNELSVCMASGFEAANQSADWTAEQSSYSKFILAYQQTACCFARRADAKHRLQLSMDFKDQEKS